MEQIWQWGIDVIIHVQKIRSPFIDNVFICTTFLGTPEFYTLFLPGLYWCFDKKITARIIFLFFVSSWSNSVLKTFFNHPRPFELNGAVKVCHAGGPGLPSGHAQQSVVLWTSLALWLKRRPFSVIALLLILIVSFSRIYLGVHFPTDVFCGWLIGAVIILSVWPFFSSIEKFLSGLNIAILITFILFLPLLLSFVQPTRWSVMPAGALSGFLIGMIAERKYIGFTSPGSVYKAIARITAGMFILAVLFSLEKISGIGKSARYYLFIVYIKSWIMGIWVSAGAPWMFCKFKI